ncbi:hypothetical protein EW145_g4676 [Phellinidium pouzarii]|uniref:Uncharacterized protein n=1 Tax=Phellinidium pouzarii TaxID=167371 RepID=A0A4S4L2V1_9AGAM|nr:hypothetical protein EW145_g4676 [Phellinidium pouzarii]
MFSFSRTDKPVLAPISTPGRGYLAFPAGYSLTPEQKLNTLDQQAQRERQEREADQESLNAATAEAEQARISFEQAWQKRQRFQDKRRQALEARERDEALKGEKHWVRQGGFLRDADGRRDERRTEEVRRLVEQEDAERRIRERWETYESVWTRIVSSNEPVVFANLPWPLINPPKSPLDLRNPTGIADFLFESLSLKGNTTTRRDRLRMSLLRWHPDKLGAVLARVPVDDLNLVKDGIDAVVISLMHLQEAEKAR